MDSSRLSTAIKLRLGWGKRTLPQICNTSAYYIARNAAGGTPFSSIDRIDSELGTVVVPAIGKRGKPLKSLKKASLSGTAMGRDIPSVTLAKLIILARANLLKLKPSNYNQRTNFRYQLDPSQLKGGKAVIEGFISRMIKARHSSIKFLRSGWIPAINALEPYAFKRGGAAPKETKSFMFGDRGTATPATEGWRAEAMIENATGLAGQNAANFNQALLEHGMAPLQAAINQEEASMVKYMEEHQKPANDRFNAMCV